MFTGYFARLKAYEAKGLIPVAICGKAPDWYKGHEYKVLAPKWEFFNEWKNGEHEGDNDYFTKHYKEEVLDKLYVQQVVNDLLKFGPLAKIVLVCYEKTGDFCHRHIVADWFNTNGIGCIEYLLPVDFVGVIAGLTQLQGEVPNE